jgi:hypothetical protein
MRNAYKMIRKPEEKGPLRRPMHTWEDNIKILGPFEKFVDCRQCAAVMLLCLPLHNGALPPVHELFKRPS